MKISRHHRAARKQARERIVVAGAGLAGLRAAERLREQGFTGELVMIGAERYPAYHRPALSKQLLRGELRPRELMLRSYVPLDAQWRLGTAVLRLDPKRHVVELAGEEEIRYDGLVIATGVQARHLAGAPRHDPRVHVLRTLGDGIGLRRALSRRGRVVVIGSGFTACEVASTAHQLGREVTVLSRSGVLLGKAIGKELGTRMTGLHRANGIRVETGVEVAHWQPQPWGIDLLLTDGRQLTAGTVVLAVGGTPAVQWLRGSGLVLEDGVLCRPTCHVVGDNDIVAAGDVARWPNLRFEATARRIEHWMNAIDMGRAAAENLLAGAAAARPFTPLPRFWSEQHGVRIQAAGMPVLGQDTIRLTRGPDERGITGYLRNGRLIGVLARDDPRGMIGWTEELTRELRRPETVTTPAVRPETPQPPTPPQPATPSKAAAPEPTDPVIPKAADPAPRSAPIAAEAPTTRTDRPRTGPPVPVGAAARRPEPTITGQPVSGGDRRWTEEFAALTEPVRRERSPLWQTREGPGALPPESDDDRPPHPSMPNMQPVPRPSPYLSPYLVTPRAREQQLLEWQFRQE